MTLLEVHELSLLGLFERIAEVERVKDSVKTPSEEQSALMATESAAKKELGERLQGASGAGLNGEERQKARGFLQAQARAVDSTAHNSKARKAKIEELLANVERAPNIEEPAHVQKARQNVKRVEKGYKEIHETFEKWEKGKARFKTVEELTAMKRQHDDLKKTLDAAFGFLEEQLRRRNGDGAAPPPAPAAATAAAAARPKPKAGAVGPGPAVHTGGRAAAAAGYPAARPAAPSAAAMRQAAAAAELRRELEEERHAAVAAAPPARQQPAAPKAPKVSAGEPPPAPVLSYSCTCQAVAELCGLSLEEARALASSSREFQEHLEEDAWAAVQERSLQIERERKEEQREAEKRKQARALAKATEMQSASVASGGSPVAKAVARPSATSQGGRGGPADAKAKPRPKGGGAKAKPKPANLAGLTHNNRFGGLDDSDDDDGWTTVKR